MPGASFPYMTYVVVDKEIFTRISFSKCKETPDVLCWIQEMFTGFQIIIRVIVFLWECMFSFQHTIYNITHTQINALYIIEGVIAPFDIESFSLQLLHAFLLQSADSHITTEIDGVIFRRSWYFLVLDIFINTFYAQISLKFNGNYMVSFSNENCCGG